MELHTLKKSKWIVWKSKRLWRWNGSWKGNYSGKGLKWQKSRSGSTTKPFFEWWQTSIVQRIPKAKWFKRHFKLIKEVVIVNLWHLDNDVRIVEGMEITKTILKDLWYIKKATSYVKLLGNWDWTKKVTFVDIDSYSKSAQEKIDNPSAKKTPKKSAESNVETKPVAKKVTAKIEEKDVKPVSKKTEPKLEDKPTTKKPAAKKVVEKASKVEKKPATKKPAAKKAK